MPLPVRPARAALPPSLLHMLTGPELPAAAQLAGGVHPEHAGTVTPAAAAAQLTLTVPALRPCPQVESTLSMQALQPKVKALQAKYAGDQERLQVGDSLQMK